MIGCYFFGLMMFWTTLVYAEVVQIEDYAKIFMPVFDEKGHAQIALRFFKKNHEPYVWVVDPIHLRSSLLAIKDVHHKNPIAHQKPASIQFSWLNKTVYGQWLAPQKAAIKHGQTKDHSAILSIDLCPSSRPFEKAFFDHLAQRGHAFPVAISISGMWILKHPNEFQYLIDLQSQGHLEITWVNHGFTHLYFSDKFKEDNFLLNNQVDFNNEILLTEKLLLEANQVPSVFFRFPGLVTNSRLLQQLKEYGLIALDADAWLAKDEVIQSGSVVLVHGNGNEHEGVKRLIPQLKKWNWVGLTDHI